MIKHENKSTKDLAEIFLRHEDKIIDQCIYEIAQAAAARKMSKCALAARDLHEVIVDDMLIESNFNPTIVLSKIRASIAGTNLIGHFTTTEADLVVDLVAWLRGWKPRRQDVAYEVDDSDIAPPTRA